MREFLYEVRFELRKVVADAQGRDAHHLVVIAVVIAVSLILAGFDVVIQWLVKLLLGR